MKDPFSMLKKLKRMLHLKSIVNEIRFAKPGEMHEKYVRGSKWHTDPKARALFEGATAIGSTEKGVAPLGTGASYATGELYAHPRSNRLKTQPPKGRITKSKKVREHLKPGVSLGRRFSPQREAMLKADVAADIHGEHSEFNKKRAAIVEAHKYQLENTYKGHPEDLIKQVKEQHKAQLNALDESYYAELRARSGYGMRLDALRRGIRKSAAAEGWRARSVLQGMRKHVSHTLPAPLPESELNRAGTGRIQVEGRSINQGEKVGRYKYKVYTGIATKHGKKAPYKLGLKEETNLPGALEEMTGKLNVAADIEGKRIGLGASAMKEKLERRARFGIQKARLDDSMAPHPKKVLQAKAEGIVHHAIISPINPEGDTREYYKKVLGLKPGELDKVRSRYQHISSPDYASDQAIRSRIIKEGKIFRPTITTQTYSRLRGLGKAGAIGGGILGAGYLARKVFGRRKQEQQFAVPANLRKELIIGSALAGGITAADVATSATFPDPDKTRAQSAWQGTKRGALYGTALAATEPFIRKALAKAWRKRKFRLSSRIPLIEFGMYKTVAPGIKIVGKAGQSKEKISDMLERLGSRQTASDWLTGLAAKIEGVSKGKMHDEFRARSRMKGTIGGTVARGKKGRRAYINRAWRKKDIGLREVVEHEAFHNKAGILGRSEIAAHFYGGLKSKKGKLDPITGIKRVRHVMASRPIRAGGEVGIVATPILIGRKIVGRKDKQTEFKSKDDTTVHDVAVGGIEGAAGFYTTDKLVKAFNPRTTGGKLLTAGLVGGAATGTIGYGLNRFLRGFKRQHRDRQFISKMKEIRFAYYPSSTEGSTSPYGPKRRLTVAQDRYRKMVRENEINRKESNLAKSAAAAGALAGVLGHKKFGITKSVIGGAAAGLGAETALLLRGRQHRDAYGEENISSKRIERIPYQAAGLGLAGIAANALRKRYKLKMSSMTPEIRFAMTPEEREHRRRLRRYEPEHLQRRGEEIYRGIGRTYRLLRDVRSQVTGAPNLDVRGRERTPEWKKQWALRAAAVGGIVAAVKYRNLGKRALNTKLGQTVKSKVKSSVEKSPLATQAVKSAREWGRGVRTEWKDLKREIAAEPKSPTEAVREYRESEAEKMARSERRRQAIKRAVESGNPLEGNFRSKLREIRLAETVPFWDIRDERGRSARIYAPGHQKRYRRSKHWHEKKQNRDLIAGALGIGGIGTGAGILHYINKSRDAGAGGGPGNIITPSTFSPAESIWHKWNPPPNVAGWIKKFRK